ncbi:MAG TPA: site-2 protease family protein [Opitutaceae bacterium]
MIDIDPEYLREGLIAFIILFVSVIVHEWGHAVAADKLGDDTPRAEGRVSLNPMVHIDLIGTIIVPIVNIFVFGNALPFIGWGRPVTTNPANYKNRARDEVLIPLAGPMANLLLALVAIVVGAFLVVPQPRCAELVREVVIMNVGLAVFNLVPIPPLDGAAMLRRAVGMSEETFLMLSRWSWIFIIAAIRFRPLAEAIMIALRVVIYPYLKLCVLISPEAALRIFGP